MIELSSAKAAAGTAVATMASGIAYAIELIPDDIGKVATLIAAVLSLVMLRYWRVQTKKAEVELQILIIERDKKADEKV